MKKFGALQILLVEDNPDDVVAAHRALSQSYLANDVHIARDGREALDFVFRLGVFGPATPTPDLILLDLHIPKYDGLEVLQQIRGNAATASLPVILLTASERDADAVMRHPLGTNSYIQKPLEFHALLKALDMLGF